MQQGFWKPAPSPYGQDNYFPGYPINTQFYPCLPPSDTQAVPQVYNGRRPDIIGQGEVTSVVLPDGRILFCFQPISPQCGHCMQYIPYSWNPNTSSWYRGNNLETACPQINAQPYGVQNCSPNCCTPIPPGYQTKFHYDQTTSTEDIEYFYPLTQKREITYDNYSPCRTTESKGVQIPSDVEVSLSQKAVTNNNRSEVHPDNAIRCNCNISIGADTEIKKGQKRKIDYCEIMDSYYNSDNAQPQPKKLKIKDTSSCECSFSEQDEEKNKRGMKRRLRDNNKLLAEAWERLQQWEKDIQKQRLERLKQEERLKKEEERLREHYSNLVRCKKYPSSKSSISITSFFSSSDTDIRLCSDSESDCCGDQIKESYSTDTVFDDTIEKDLTRRQTELKLSAKNLQRLMEEQKKSEKELQQEIQRSKAQRKKERKLHKKKMKEQKIERQKKPNRFLKCPSFSKTDNKHDKGVQNNMLDWTLSKLNAIWESLPSPSPSTSKSIYTSAPSSNTNLSPANCICESKKLVRLDRTTSCQAPSTENKSTTGDGGILSDLWNFFGFGLGANDPRERLCCKRCCKCDPDLCCIKAPVNIKQEPDIKIEPHSELEPTHKPNMFQKKSKQHYGTISTRSTASQQETTWEPKSYKQRCSKPCCMVQSVKDPNYKTELSCKPNQCCKPPFSNKMDRTTTDYDTSSPSIHENELDKKNSLCKREPCFTILSEKDSGENRKQASDKPHQGYKQETSVIVPGNDPYQNTSQSFYKSKQSYKPEASISVPGKDTGQNTSPASYKSKQSFKSEASTTVPGNDPYQNTSQSFDKSKQSYKLEPSISVPGKDTGQNTSPASYKSKQSYKSEVSITVPENDPFQNTGQLFHKSKQSFNSEASTTVPGNDPYQNTSQSFNKSKQSYKPEVSISVPGKDTGQNTSPASYKSKRSFKSEASTSVPENDTYQNTSQSFHKSKQSYKPAGSILVPGNDTGQNTSQASHKSKQSHKPEANILVPRNNPRQNKSQSIYKSKHSKAGASIIVPKNNLDNNTSHSSYKKYRRAKREPPSKTECYCSNREPLGPDADSQRGSEPRYKVESVCTTGCPSDSDE